MRWFKLLATAILLWVGCSPVPITEVTIVDAIAATIPLDNDLTGQDVEFDPGPSGIQEGDLMFALVFGIGISDIVAPDGWVSIEPLLFHKTAEAGESGPYVFEGVPSTNGEPRTGVMVVVSGGVLGDSDWLGGTEAPGVFPIPTLTAENNTARLLAFQGHRVWEEPFAADQGSATSPLVELAQHIAWGELPPPNPNNARHTLVATLEDVGAGTVSGYTLEYPVILTGQLGEAFLTYAVVIEPITIGYLCGDIDIAPATDGDVSVTPATDGDVSVTPATEAEVDLETATSADIDVTPAVDGKVDLERC